MSEIMRLSFQALDEPFYSSSPFLLYHVHQEHSLHSPGHLRLNFLNLFLEAEDVVLEELWQQLVKVDSLSDDLEVVFQRMKRDQNLFIFTYWEKSEVTTFCQPLFSIMIMRFTYV